MAASKLRRSQKKRRVSIKSKTKSNRRKSGLKTMPVIYNRDAKDGVRGWEKHKPQRVSERRKIMAVCGPKCFGKPDTFGFPICPKHIQSPKECGADCKGLLAAYGRARQWRKKNPGVAKRLRKSAERRGCLWTKRRSSKRNKRSKTKNS